MNRDLSDISDKEVSRSERSLVAVLGAVTFINLLDFVMVMPLGPSLAQGIGIPESRLGYVAAAYSAAACISGLAGAFFLERFNRKSALVVALVGLITGTLMGGLATGFWSLITARALAGAFGGPTGSLSLSALTDGVPAERRGKAMGAVMAAFSLANVFGIPLALRVATQAGWKAPFFSLAALGAAVTVLTMFAMPSLPSPLQDTAEGESPWQGLLPLFERKEIWLSYLMSAVGMIATYVFIPCLPAYLQYNLGFPGDRLDRLYLAGGFVSLGTFVFMGRSVDKFGAFPVGTVGCLLYLVILLFGFALPNSQIPAVPLCLLFFVAMGTRMVAANALGSQVPQPRERARFMSVQSSVQQASGAVGAGLSSLLLWDAGNHQLGGMRRPALIAIVLTGMLPFLLRGVEKGVAGAPRAP